MDETKVQIGEDVLLDIGIHSDWYISSIGYDGERVNVDLCRKADRHKEWWIPNSPYTGLCSEYGGEGNLKNNYCPNCGCRMKGADDEVR